jgi:hypothetical protein
VASGATRDGSEMDSWWSVVAACAQNASTGAHDRCMPRHAATRLRRPACVAAPRRRAHAASDAPARPRARTLRFFLRHV